MTVQPKHILIITREIVPFHYGGIGTQFKSLAGFLRRQGHHVSFLTEKHDNFEEEAFRRHYGDLNLLFVEDVSDDPVMRPLSYAEAVAKAFDLYYMNHPLPDAVICADFEAECLFLVMKACIGDYERTRFIININGMTHDVLSAYEDDDEVPSEESVLNANNVRIISVMENLCIGLADELVPSTQHYWDKICNRLNIESIVRPIPNFCDVGIFIEPSADEDESRYTVKRSKIVFVGRLDRMKGPDILLKAYLKLFENQTINLPEIVFIGRDCYWKAYGETFLEHWHPRIPPHLAEKIKFTGQIEHHKVVDYLREAAFCVFPSRLEPFGIVCLEAMGIGCPVVVPTETGLEEVVGKIFPQGLFTHDEDGRNLVESMQYLLENPPSQKMRYDLRKRAIQLNELAEQGWIHLIDSDILTRTNRAAKAQWAGPILELIKIFSQQDNFNSNNLQIYFSRKQNYNESDSIRIAYRSRRWETLTIKLPRGTGDPYLRLDPVDRSGEVLIQEITLCDTQGRELWRSDGRSNFKEVTCRDSVKMIRQEDLLLLIAVDNDPQLFLDCPSVTEAVSLTTKLFLKPYH